MHRFRRKAKLESREARRGLKGGNEPYWVKVDQALALGYRKGSTTGTWHGRTRIGSAYIRKRLGIANDFRDADNRKVFDYWQAQMLARAWAAKVAREADPAWQEAQRAEHAAAYSVGDACDDYLKWFREHRKSLDATQATIDAHIRPALARRTIAELTTEDIKAWRDQLARQHPRKRSRRGSAPTHRMALEKLTGEQRDDAKRARRATANRILAVLKAILNKAFEDEKAKDDSSWRRVKPFPHVDVPRVRFLTEAESLRLVNASDADFRPLLRAALLTGARYGELARMTVGAFNPNTSQVFIAPSKSGKSRYVPLNAAGAELFRTLTIGRESGAPLFVRQHGEAWGKNHQQRPILEACTKAKIAPSLRFHECRHTYASMLAQAGADLLTISKLLGHADTRITARHYAHLCDRTLANAVNAMLPNFGAVEPTSIAAIR